MGKIIHHLLACVLSVLPAAAHAAPASSAGADDEVRVLALTDTAFTTSSLVDSVLTAPAIVAPAISLPDDSMQLLDVAMKLPKHRLNCWDLPYSFSRRGPYNWRQLWINTGTLVGAFVGTLLVLECLPEDATSWNRAELQDVPLNTRWYDHVVKEGPEWDHDKFIFNYVLHPYAGAVYFMSARSCGFNFWQSLLYCSIISNIGWEYGIEAFMERPSYQDLMITPLVGSSIGELFYRLKRNIVNNGYRLWGSSVAGNIVAFLIDPVNEVVGLLSGNDARRHARYVNEYNAVVRSSRFSLIDNISSTPFAYDRGRVCPGLTLKITF